MESDSDIEITNPVDQGHLTGLVYGYFGVALISAVIGTVLVLEGTITVGLLAAPVMMIIAGAAVTIAARTRS